MPLVSHRCYRAYCCDNDLVPLGSDAASGFDVFADQALHDPKKPLAGLAGDDLDQQLRSLWAGARPETRKKCDDFAHKARRSTGPLTVPRTLASSISHRRLCRSLPSAPSGTSSWRGCRSNCASPTW